MATGAYDDEGIWRYGEDDPASPFSDTLNLLAASTSVELAAARARISSLESQLAAAQDYPVRRIYWPTDVDVLTDTVEGLGTATVAFSSGQWSSGIHTSILQFPQTGLYLIRGGVRWSAASSNDGRRTQLRVNVTSSSTPDGDIIAANWIPGPPSDSQHTDMVERLYPATAGQTLMLVVYQATGFTQTVLGGGDSTFLEAEYRRPWS